MSASQQSLAPIDVIVADVEASGSLVWTADELAPLLRISRATAYRGAHLWIESGGADGIPAVKVRGRLLFPKKAIQAWLGVPTP